MRNNRKTKASIGILMIIAFVVSGFSILVYDNTMLKKVVSECSEKIYEANMGHQVSNPCLNAEGLY